MLDVVEDFNKTQSVENSSRQSMSKDDVKFLLDKGIIHIEPNNKVVWCGGGDMVRIINFQRLKDLLS